MPDTRPVDTSGMDTPAVRHRPDVTPADGAMESLERLLGEQWGRAMWVDACHRAGVSPRATASPDDLRRVARELCDVPGPAALIGRALTSQVTVCEGLAKRPA